MHVVNCKLLYACGDFAHSWPILRVVGLSTQVFQTEILVDVLYCRQNIA